MDTIKLEIPRAALKALHKVLDYELNPDSFRCLDDCVDFRDFDRVENLYNLSRIYQAVCKHKED
jgi:hypothetical protein